MRQMTNPKKL